MTKPRNAHGLEPSPAKAFEAIEIRESFLLRERTKAENRLTRLRIQRAQIESKIEKYERRIREINSMAPSWGRNIK